MARQNSARVFIVVRIHSMPQMIFISKRNQHLDLEASLGTFNHDYQVKHT